MPVTGIASVVSLPTRAAHAARSARDIAKGNDGLRCCSRSANSGKLANDTLMMVTSRRTPSTAWRYISGNVSLSPTVKKIAFAGSVWSALVAKSLAK